MAPADSEVPKPPPTWKPWWESAVLVAIVSGLFASIVPVTTFIRGRTELDLAQKKQETELALAQKKQDHAVQMEYINLVTRDNLGVENRESVLRFLARTATRPENRLWAAEELKKIEAVALSKREEMDNLKHLREKLEAKEARDRAAELEKRRQLNEFTRRIEELRNQLERPARRLPYEPRFQCVTGTVSASAGSQGSTNQEEDTATCLASLTAARNPPAGGTTNLSSFVYHWPVNRLTCQCLIAQE